jgi:E3 Ubiquitin ligase
VRGSQPPPYPVIAVIAAALTLFALWRFFVRLRRERLVADTPEVRIRSAAQGYVKVTGLAQPSGTAPFASPLTSRPCVWWSYEIAHREHDSKGNTRWSVEQSAASVDLFVLADGDAQCLVGPVKAEITPTTHDIWFGEDSWPPGPPPDGDFSVPLLHTGAWRYTERLLGVGDRLTVMGELRSHSEVGDVNAAIAAKLHEWKQDQGALLERFDLDHDGTLSPAEWEAAREAAAAECQTQKLQSQITRTSVISQPSNGEPFLIAPRSTAQLEQRERLYAALDFALGLIGVIVCAWAIRHAA